MQWSMQAEIKAESIEMFGNFWVYINLFCTMYSKNFRNILKFMQEMKGGS